MNRNQEKYIKDNYMTKTNKEISKVIGVSEATIIRFLSKNNLSRRKKFKLKRNEILVDIEGFSKYKVSSFGRFVRLKDMIEIQQSYTPDGYKSIKLVDDNGKRHTMRVNRVVLYSFEPIENSDKYEANHKDGNIENNKYSNLEWLTPSENQKHAYENNLRKPITRKQCVFTKHTEDEIREICKYLEEGLRPIEIKNKCKFNPSDGLINSIKQRKRWKDISKEYNF